MRNTSFMRSGGMPTTWHASTKVSGQISSRWSLGTYFAGVVAPTISKDAFCRSHWPVRSIG